MNKQAITGLLTKNYTSFTDYINGLTPEEFIFSNQQKWTAGQQLNHIMLCVKPLVQVFSMDRAAIEHTFGRADHASCSYDALMQHYRDKLEQGGKAPTRFLPEPVTIDQRAALCTTLETMIKDLCSKVDNFTEDDLDHLSIPHPLLGNLTMREMLYNGIYHVQHHQEQAQEYLGYFR